MKQTKIICTLGPSTDDVDVLCDMLEAGMDVARLNLSHSDYEHHDETIELLEEAREKTSKDIPLLADTRGPEVRTGYVEGYDEDKDTTLTLEEGSVVRFVCSEEDAEVDGERCTPECIYLSYEDLPNDVKEGQTFIIDEGKASAEIMDIKGREFTARITNDAEIGSRKGVNFPESRLRLPTVSEKDKEDIEYALEKGADFVALSFIRNAQNVIDARDLIDSLGGEDVKIISKIENKEGVKNIDEILDLSDGIMIARGDLGVEIPYSDVPTVQKEIINKTLVDRKVVVTATEMLDSMERQPNPTRAEVSDVYNAVKQGSTCLMLSGETATGKFPVEAVQTMAKTIEAAEENIDYKKRFFASNFEGRGHVTTSVCYSTVATAYNVNAKAVVAFTRSGNTARNVSAFRPEVPIIVSSPDEKVVRQCHILWGVHPVSRNEAENIEGLFENAEEIAKDMDLVEPGDGIVTVAGTPVGVPGSTNTIRVSKIGDVKVKGYPYSEGKATGKIRICRSAAEAEKLREGDIAVIFKLDSSYEKFYDKVSAILVASNNYEKSALEKAKSLGIPILVDVRSVPIRLREGMEVTVNADKGVVLTG